MKTKYILAIIFICVLFMSCKNHSTEPVIAPPEQSHPAGLAGNWLWRYSSGGITGGTIYPTAGNTYFLQITSDSNFIEKQNDTITFSDQFSLVTDTLYHRPVIDFQNSKRFNLVILYLTDDSLVLGDWGIADGYTHFYTRLILMTTQN